MRSPVPGRRSPVPDRVPGGSFAAASAKAVSLLGLLNTLNELMGTRIEPNFKPARTGDVRDSLADISLSRSVLGYQPNLDLRAGLKPTIDFYR